MTIVLISLNSGGLFHYACSMANALRKQCPQDRIVLITSSYNDIKSIAGNTVTLNAPHNLKQFIWWAIFSGDHKKFARILSEEQPTVIHILDSYPIYLRYFFALRNYPVVFTQHDPIPHSGDKFSLVTRLVNIYLQKICRRLIVHGDSLKKAVININPAIIQRTSSIRLGYFPNLVPKQSNAMPGSILFFGRIVDYKGLGILLESAKILNQKKCAYVLTIAGPGDLTPYMSALGDLPQTVIQNKYLPDEKVQELFSSNEIVVMPYKEATQSAIAALAIAAGKVVVATRVGALVDILEDGRNSLLVPPNNPTALAGALERVLNNGDLRRQLASNALKTAQDKLSWTAIARDLVSIYSEIL